MRAIRSSHLEGRCLTDRAALSFSLSAMSSLSGLDAPDISLIKKIASNKYKILVIDDDDKFRRSFCFKLRRIFNAQVDDANSGRSGVEKVKGGGVYDFIFTDIMMPEMTGIETYRILRTINVEMPIVMMSAYSDSEEWKNAQSLEDVSLLHKPIPVTALIRVLGRDIKE